MAETAAAKAEEVAAAAMRAAETAVKDEMQVGVVDTRPKRGGRGGCRYPPKLNRS